MSIIAPISISAVNGHQLRYFKSPLDGPDFPWHAYLDLLAAMSLPDDVQEHFLRMVRSGPYRDDTRVLATSAGPTVIAPHYMAQGFIGALDEGGWAPAGFEHAYCQGLSDAMDALVGDLPPQARFEMTMAMAKRHMAFGESAGSARE